MSVVAVNINAVLIGTAETIIIPAIPAGQRYDVPTIRFANIDIFDHQVIFYNRTPPGEAANDTTTEFKRVTIKAQSTFEIGPLVLPAGRQISATCDVANKVSARVHAWSTQSIAVDIAAILLQTTETIIIPTIPVGQRYEVPAIRFANLEDPPIFPNLPVPHQITIFNYSPASESPGDTVSEYKTITIKQGSTFEYGPLVLPPGRRISATVDVNDKVNARVHAWRVLQ